MSSFAAHSLKLLRQLLHPTREAPHAGVEAVLDGLTAVAVTEAAMSDTAALGAGWPATNAERAWNDQRMRRRLNRLGEVLASVEAECPRDALAAAIGASMSGQRATAFLAGPDLLAAPDLLAFASGRHVPLVMHLAARAAAGHAQSIGGGHEAYHAAADTGCFLLHAINVQEAADLALVARRVAERALVPGVVAVDGEQTALAMQDVRLPDDELIRAYIGAAHTAIETPTPAQRFIFGDTRRLVPRLYDLEHPLMLSPLEGPESWALGVAGRRPYFDDHVPALLDEAFDAFAETTGRHYGGVFEHNVDRAEIVLVAQGAAVETLAAVADAARHTRGVRVGVLGVRCLRPLPTGRIAAALRGVGSVAVLERTATPLADGPLSREIRSVLDRARENARFGPDTHPGCPAVADRDLPRVISVPYGLGGAPLRAADLLALVAELKTPRRARLFLGLDFASSSHDAPRQQALTDALRRSYPDLANLGLRGNEPPPDLRPRDAITIAVRRRTGPGHESVAAELAVLLHGIFGGHVRTRPALTWPQFGEPCVDLVTHASTPLRDPGDDPPLDLTLESDLRPTSGLGEVVGFVARRRGGTVTASAVRAAREGQLADVPEDLRETRLDAFMAAYESALTADSEPPAPAPTPTDDFAAPPLVRVRDATPDTLHALPRFWNHVGVLYRTGDTERLVADPCLAMGAVPPLSSTFRDVSGAVDVLPAFDPPTCDGSPDLWMSDPDGAVAPLVISARALLDAGMDLATERGRTVDALRAVAAKLARQSNTAMTSDTPPVTAGAMLIAAFDAVTESMDETRRATLREALDAVVEVVGALPVARTPVFFDEPESRQSGTGELFTLVVNADACRSPEISIAAGAGRGIVAVERTDETVAAARGLLELWQRLPDTSGQTIERARTHPDVGALAALTLSRHCLHAMAPGDGAEAGSGARLALARVLSVAESHYQPRVQQLLAEVESLRTQLGERIRETLAGALPTDDLDALAHGLDALGRADVDVAALSSRIDTAVTGGRVDGMVLGRLVDVARGLADLQWHLSRGASGLGRARLGLAIAPGAVAEWAGTFPYNPFQGPVLVGAGPETGPMARGLLEGQLRQTLAGLRLLRAARLALDAGPDAETALARLAELRHEDLDDVERQLVPPVLLVGDDRGLGGGALGELVSVLSDELPVKVVVLADLDGARHDLALLGMATRRAFVTQTSLADPGHFADGVRDALAHDGPALITIHTPSPRRHGFPVARLHEQMRLAIATRVHPLLRFDPVSGGVFGACLDLRGNPDVTTSLSTDAAGGTLTPVDWAVTETRFADHVEPLDGDPDPTPIAEFLALPPERRAGRTPCIVTQRDGREQRLRVGPALVADADRRLRLWRTLQELAGVVTPFTAAVREAAERDVAARHEAEIVRLRAEHESRVTDLRQTMHEETARRITERLLVLAGRGVTESNGKDAS